MCVCVFVQDGRVTGRVYFNMEMVEVCHSMKAQLFYLNAQFSSLALEPMSRAQINYFYSARCVHHYHHPHTCRLKTFVNDVFVVLECSENKVLSSPLELPVGLSPLVVSAPVVEELDIAGLGPCIAKKREFMTRGSCSWQDR